MRDQNIELAYIAGYLYGNIKQRDYIKKNQIELKDVVLFKTTYSNSLKRNRQQNMTPEGLEPGKYEVVAVEGDGISLRHVEKAGGTFKVSRRNIF